MLSASGTTGQSFQESHACERLSDEGNGDVIEERDGRQENGMLLTLEEEASLPLLEPLFACHLDLILENLSLHLRSDPDVASLLSDDLAVVRLKRSQQEYLLSLLNGKNEGSIGRDGPQAAQYRDPFGLGAGCQLRTVVHFLTSIQPLVFEAFWARPTLHHTVWNALLKVIFRDLELAMSASLKQRDDRVEAARQDLSEMRRALDLVLNKQVTDESQRQAEHRTVVRLLAAWLTKMSGSAQEMGTPLNVILGQAELLLEQTEDGKTRAALQSIVRQVDRMIPLREQLCSLDHGLGREFYALDLKATGAIDHGA
jgi:signal transduction histidine kinase